jgi:hypothetical protein
MLSTVYKDKQKGEWQERIGNLIVQLKKDEKVKSVGIVKINLVDYIDSADKVNVRQSIKLEKCPDDKAIVEFTVKSVLVSSGATGSETMSLVSDAMSVDSGPESEFDFAALEAPVEESKTGPKRRQGSQVRAPRRV